MVNDNYIIAHLERALKGYETALEEFEHPEQDCTCEACRGIYELTHALYHLQFRQKQENKGKNELFIEMDKLQLQEGIKKGYYPPNTTLEEYCHLVNQAIDRQRGK